jgi:hypothetical protein
MLICQSCWKDRAPNNTFRWRIAGKSKGNCECCNAMSTCADIPSAQIPIKLLTAEEIFRCVFPDEKWNLKNVKIDPNRSVTFEYNMQHTHFYTVITKDGFEYFIFHAHVFGNKHHCVQLSMSIANGLVDFVKVNLF